MSFYLCTTCNLTNPEKSVDKRIWSYQGSIHTWYFWYLRLYNRMYTNPLIQIIWDNFVYFAFVAAIVFLTSSEDADEKFPQVSLLFALGLTAWTLQNFIPMSMFPFSMENTMTNSSNSALLNSAGPLVNTLLYTFGAYFFLGLIRFWNTGVLPNFYTTFSVVLSVMFFIIPIIVLTNKLFIMTYKDAPIVFDPVDDVDSSKISLGIAANTTEINGNRNKKTLPQNVLIKGYAEALKEKNIQSRIEKYWQNRKAL